MEVYKIVESYLDHHSDLRGSALFHWGTVLVYLPETMEGNRPYRRAGYSALQGPGRVSGDDSDGVLMGRPAVALPPLVQRQFVPQ